VGRVVGRQGPGQSVGGPEAAEDRRRVRGSGDPPADGRSPVRGQGAEEEVAEVVVGGMGVASGHERAPEAVPTWAAPGHSRANSNSYWRAARRPATDTDSVSAAGRRAARHHDP